MKKAIMLRGSLLEPINEARREAIREMLPDHEIIAQPDDEHIAEAIDRIEIVFGSLPQGLWNEATALKWLQLQGAGADRIVDRLPGRNMVVTNASGVHAEPISEHLLAMLLALARDIPLAFRHQRLHSWKYDRKPAIFELGGKRALLIGTGAIGHAFAIKATALGMEMVGVRRHPKQDEPYLRVVGPEALHRELPEADFVVVTVPFTPETERIIGAEELSVMKDGARIFNIGRGGTIDQAAMVEALQSGRLAGAGLDVFDPEPLPEDSPLWDMENVVLTTHYAGLTPHYADRVWEIFLDNLARYVAGTPLRNVVDAELGY